VLGCEANSTTSRELKQVFDALRELMTPSYPPKRPIGFVTHEDNKKTSKNSATPRLKK
jgi:hypothetical protein